MRILPGGSFWETIGELATQNYTAGTSGDEAKEMSNTRRRWEFILKFSMFTILAEMHGIHFVPTSFYRTAKEQEKRFKAGKSLCDGRKKISKHQLWRAMDIVIIDEDNNPIWEGILEYEILGDLWKKLGGTWGGDWYKEGKTKFYDCYHFEY